MKNIGNMMKQAQDMQKKMETMQNELDQTEITGGAGAGMVTITMTAKGDLKKVTIAPDLLNEDKEILEDLIVAGFNDTKSKADAHVAEETQKIMGGLNLPAGLKLPF